MSFNESKFREQLKEIDNTESKINSLVSNICFYRETSHEAITKIWAQMFLSTINSKTQMYLIYLADKVLEISSRSVRFILTKRAILNTFKISVNNYSNAFLFLSIILMMKTN